MKSSAASISILLPSLLGGRLATPIRRSGLPVVKKKGSGTAGAPSPSTNANVESKRMVSRINILLSGTCEPTNRHTAAEVSEERKANLCLIGGDPALVTRFLEKSAKNIGRPGQRRGQAARRLGRVKSCRITQAIWSGPPPTVTVVVP